MKKRCLFLVIICLIFAISIFFVIRLTYKNSTLRYISEDSRQIELLRDLSINVIENKVEEENIKIEFDSEFFLNFVNNTAYVTSQKEELSEAILAYSSKEKDANVYTVSTFFNPKKLLLTITISEPEEKDPHLSYEVTYKLSKNKDNTIKFKEKKSVKHIIGY